VAVHPAVMDTLVVLHEAGIHSVVDIHPAVGTPGIEGTQRGGCHVGGRRSFGVDTAGWPAVGRRGWVVVDMGRRVGSLLAWENHIAGMAWACRVAGWGREGRL